MESLKVRREGFTLLSHGVTDVSRSDCKPIVNIILLHGLRGHPQHTWEHKRPDKPKKPDQITRRKRRIFSSFRANASYGPVEGQEVQSTTPPSVFWPAQYLAQDIPNARVFTYGYSADVIRGIFQPNNKNSILQHSQTLCAQLERELEDEDPIIFVAHSLGGIVVKDVLHLSRPTRERTKLIVFLGTPHRGSTAAEWGKIANNIARAALLDTNKRLVEALSVDNEVLDRIHNEFKTVVVEQSIKIHSFQESQGISGVTPLNEKVVADFSSKVDLPSEYETVETLDANHMSMAKFSSREDPGYVAVCGVIKGYIRKHLVQFAGAQDRAEEPNQNRVALVPVGQEKRSMNEETLKLSDLNADEKTCLQGFSSDYSTPRHKIRAHHPGTCEWILRHRDFRKWKEEVINGGPLWISGNPGMGKSVFSKILVHSFESGPSERNKVVYYFCDAGNTRYNSAISLVRAIIHQCIQLFPYLLRKHVWSQYEAHGQTTHASFAILWKIFICISTDPGLGDIYCVLDALDECEEKSRDELLKQIGIAFSNNQESADTMTTASSLKLIITSRPYESIRARLFPFASIRLRAENEELEINRDIARYIDNEVPKLAELRHYDTDLQEYVRSALTAGGDGMFLWVSLMIDVLERTPTRSVRNRIKSMPRDIESIYDRVLEEIPDESREAAFKMLMWVAFAHRPLFVQELGVACTIDCPSGHSSQTTIIAPYSRDNILGDIQLCGPILKVQPDDSVHLVHQTTKEYLLQLSSSTCVPRPFVGENDAHYEMALVCLTYLTVKNDENLESFLGRINPWFELDYPFLQDPWDRLQKDLPLIRYASTFWHDHIHHLSPDDDRIWAALQTTLNSESLARRYPILQVQSHPRRHRRPRKGDTHLHILIYNGLEHHAIRYVDCETFDVNAQSLDGSSVLHLAAERGYCALVTKLLSHNADVHLLQCINKNINHPYSSSGFEKTGTTALHLAVSNGHIEVARLLLQHGADPKAIERGYRYRSRMGERACQSTDIKRAPLHIAVSKNNLAITQLLLECGARAEAREYYFSCTRDCYSVYRTRRK